MPLIRPLFISHHFSSWALTMICELHLFLSYLTVSLRFIKKAHVCFAHCCSPAISTGPTCSCRVSGWKWSLCQNKIRHSDFNWSYFSPCRLFPLFYNGIYMINHQKYNYLCTYLIISSRQIIEIHWLHKDFEAPPNCLEFSQMGKC